MQKRAFEEYENIFAPLPTEKDSSFYIDKNHITLPFSEDFPRMHYHDRYELGICEGGEGLFLSEGEFFSVTKNDIIFVPPYFRHYSRSLSPASPCICRFAYINAKKLAELTGGGDMPFERNIPTVLRAAEHPSQNEAIRAIMDICRENKKNADRVAPLKLASFLLEWEQNTEPCAEIGANEEFLLTRPAQKAAHYICLHYNENQKASELSKIFHLSESQLRRQFIRLYKMPPIAYRNRVRCRIAAELLTKSNLSVAEISEKVGFGSTSDFYRAFRAFSSLSPTEYRKSYQHENEQ